MHCRYCAIPALWLCAFDSAVPERAYNKICNRMREVSHAVACEFKAISGQFTQVNQSAVKKVKRRRMQW